MRAAKKREAPGCGCVPGRSDCPAAARIKADADKLWKLYDRTGDLEALAACRAKVAEYGKHHEAARVSDA